MFFAMQNTSSILIPFSPFASDPKAPIHEYKDWLIKISKKSDIGAYVVMYE